MKGIDMAMVEGKQFRNGGDSWKAIVQYAIPLASIMFAVGVAYTSLSSRVMANEKAISAVVVDVKVLDTIVRTNREDIIKIQGDVEYIKQGVDLISASVNKLNDAIKANRGSP